jgi:tRNA(Ile)-lysidine synthase
LPAPDPAALPLRLPSPLPGGRFLVAYSGGLDSTVLLHLLAGSTPAAPLLAAHVHHGLQAAADDWATHCKQACRRLKVAFRLLHVAPARGPRLSLEAEARSARYAALRSAMQPGDVLVTAHHLDDQAETLLLQLLRGAGPRGLAAMAAVSEFPPGLHARPLLAYTRDRLEAYARAQALDWIDDPSNADPAHSRNFLRHEVMPRLRRRWPEVAAVLGRSAALCAEAGELLDSQAEDDLEWCAGAQPGSLMIPALRQFTPARRHNLLRAWIGWLGLPLPEAQHLLRIETELMNAAADATPLLAWPGAELRRYRDSLYASTPLPETEQNWSACLRPESGATLELPASAGRLVFAAAETGKRLRRPGPDEPVNVRLAREGERLQLAGLPHHGTLKNLCQRAGIPPWLRRRLPVILYGDAIAAVADRWICAGFEAGDGQPGWRLCWQDPPPGYPGE